jgi:hypothetical protein
VEGRSAGTLPGKALCDARSGGTAKNVLGAGFSGDIVAGSGFSSVFNIFTLPRIYNMFFTARARFDFHPGTGRTGGAVLLMPFRVIRYAPHTVA